MAGHDEWQTPSELFKVLDYEFHFDLDAAATYENRMVGNHLGPGAGSDLQDALTSPWIGTTVWCNPPYSKLPTFVERAYNQSKLQHNTVVLLIPAYTDTRYWWNYIVPHADEVRFLKGRLQFLEGGKKKQSARFPSCVVVFRDPKTYSNHSDHVHCWWWDWRAT